MRYFTLFPSLRVTERTICLPSSVANVCSAATRLERLVLFTVSTYSQINAPVNATSNSQPYWPILVCLFIARLRCRSKNWRYDSLSAVNLLTGSCSDVLGG